jgi:hypothetical protein
MSSLWSAFSSPYLDRFVLTITQLANLNIRKSGRSLSTTVVSSGPGTALTLPSWNTDDSCGSRALSHNLSFHLSIQILNKRCPPHRLPLCSSQTTSLTIRISILSLFLQVSLEYPRQPYSAGTFKHVRSSCIFYAVLTFGMQNPQSAVIDSSLEEIEMMSNDVSKKR